MPQTPQQRLDALLARLSPAVRQAFLEMIQRKATTINLTELADELDRAIQTGDASRIIAMLQLNQAQTFPLAEALRTPFIAGGQSVGDGLPLALRAHFGFGINPRAAAQVDRITAKLITGIIEEQAATTRALITRAVNEGIPARTLALQIVGTKNPVTGIREGGYLGLDGPRADQAARVNAMLRDPALIKDYFIGSKPQFTTTDRRFDARVRRAIAEGRALSKEDADKISALHRARLLKNRGDTISRNETLNALRAGERAGFQQMVDDGTVADSRVIREWIPTRDQRTRPDHVEMTGQKHFGMAAAFTFPDGTQALFPGDTSLGGSTKETILCRCMVSYRLKRPGTN